MTISLKLLAFVLPVLACGHTLASVESGGSESGTEDSTSGPSSTETTTETTATATSGVFFPEPDVDNTIPCDPFMQDCPEGQKCVPYSSSGGNHWDANKCVPVLGDAVLGEPCKYDGTLESTDTCDASSFCWNPTPEGGGYCVAFCGGTADDPVCPENSSCLILADGSPNMCIPICDPVAQNCDNGLACDYDYHGFECRFSTGNIPPGEPCGTIDDCASGNICVSAERMPNCNGSACCSSWCEVGAGDPECLVLPGTVCMPFFEEGMAPPGYDHVGVCILP